MIPDFKRLLRVLIDGEVPFVLVGGYSAMLHGSTLMTRDVDIVCPMTPDVLRRLQTALDPFSPVHRMSPEKPSFTLEQCSQAGWKNLYLRTSLGVLDCLGEVLGLGDYDACRINSISLKLDDFSIQTLSIEALIEAKKAMNRPRDLQTAKELEMIANRRSD